MRYKLASQWLPLGMQLSYIGFSNKLAAALILLQIDNIIFNFPFVKAEAIDYSVVTQEL